MTITNESEAMEVWLHARREYNCGRGFADNEAAARVIATALEARDAEIARLRQINSQLVTEHNTMNLHGAKQDARIAELEGALRNPPGHHYWGAGEPDCPREIKCSNGELHTMRCKVCGEDSPRNPICLAALGETTNAS